MLPLFLHSYQEQLLPSDVKSHVVYTHCHMRSLTCIHAMRSFLDEPVFSGLSSYKTPNLYPCYDKLSRLPCFLPTHLIQKSKLVFMLWQTFSSYIHPSSNTCTGFFSEIYQSFYPVNKSCISHWMECSVTPLVNCKPAHLTLVKWQTYVREMFTRHTFWTNKSLA